MTYSGVSVVLAPGASHTYGGGRRGHRLAAGRAGRRIPIPEMEQSNSGYVDNNGRGRKTSMKAFKPYALLRRYRIPQYVLNSGTNNRQPR